MKRSKLFSAVIMTLLLTGCASGGQALGEAAQASLAFDTSAWQYNETDDVYYQIGVQYCASPVDTAYETLGVFVPGAYFRGETVSGYTVDTAPMVIPVNTPGYSAMKAPTAYEAAAATYTKAGFVYVMAGCRGREQGAPAGVTDLKAAVRYLRYNDAVLPGDTQRIFTFGMSGGGAQSALMGATGDSELYTPYLNFIGAAMTDEAGNALSDAVAGAMAWCPVTSLDYANEAYEWNMGQFSREGLDESTQKLSDGLANAYASYINELGLTDSAGNVLALDPSQTGIYASGSYYEYLLQTAETSLNHFLGDTSFPYTPQTRGGFGGFGGASPENGGQRPQGKFPQGEGPQGQAPQGGSPQEGGFTPPEGGAVQSVTYATAQEYIDSLNADGQWVAYDAGTNTATITDMASFVTHMKKATKSVGAFDDLNRSQAENMVFGLGDGAGLHFDPVMAELLKDDATYGAAYRDDLAKLDSLGNTIDYRQNMYNPMYYLEDYYAGYQSASVAKYWRIRSGIQQGDAALTVETNLALALGSYPGVQSVDFETVWGQGHTTAERTGDSGENFIAWVNACLK